MASPNHTEDEFESAPFDPAQPLKGIIVCCTSIPPDQRTSIASRVTELGGVHKYDLTPDVTHLIVGDYDTPKYRHVARERSDIKAMDATWIEALTELWKNDDEIDFRALESEHQLKPLEKRGTDLAAPTAGRDSLLICLTGFGDQRDEIARKITSNGGTYTGDLTRRCTHLIVNKPEGKKFVAAKAWSIYAVTLEWLNQSVARGMILEEAKFDPILPAGEQGKGAWVKKDPRRASLGKRSRSLMTNGAEDGPRKLRKTASMKLTSQRNNLWGDILGRSTSREYSFAQEEKQAGEAPQEPKPEPEEPKPTVPALPEPEGVFGHCYFYIHGFTPQRITILEQTIITLGGRACSFLHEAALGPFSHPGEPRGRFLIVPQASQPDTHPPANYEGLYVVTEYYIEKCLHNKSYFDPNEHVLGRPFPLFPIPGFSDLTICTAAFTGIELNQVARGVAQLGARFEEEFRRGTSVLICKSLTAMRKEKLRMALKWNVRAVSADWLWECISTGYNVPLDDYVFPELKKHYEAAKELQEQQPLGKPKPVTNVQSPTAAKTLHRTHSEPALRRTSSKIGQPKPLARAGVDTSGFDHDSPEKPKSRPKPSESHDSLATADFATALTHPVSESFAKDDASEVPLTEASNTRLNKSPSPTKRDPLPRTVSEPAKAAATRTSPPAEDATTVEQKRKEEQRKQQADEARRQAKAAERQALSTKLTGLIGSMGSSTTTASHNSATDDDPFAHHPAVPRPRRRQILGRAISNVSNASSDAARSDSLRDSEAPVAEDVPRPTQLEYHDPRAEEVKAALINRMLGGDVKPAVTKAAETVSAVGGRSLRRRS